MPITVVGQDKLINKINGLSLSNFPKTVLLVGNKGCGKHTLCRYISQQLNIPMLDITDKLDLDCITEIYLTTLPTLYIINITDISVKEENTILKFIEEPPSSAIIVLLSNMPVNTVIPTIVGRCQIWNFENYNKDTLLTFFDDKVSQIQRDYCCLVCNTPGQILSTQYVNLQEMFDLCDKIYKCIGKANFANVLTLSNKIAFKDEQNKFDFDIFVNVLSYTITNLIKTNKDIRLINAYKCTNKLYNDRYISHINKCQLFEKYLLELKNCLKD